MAGTATSRLEESGDQAPHSIRWRQLGPASTLREHLECGEFSPLFGPGTCHRRLGKGSVMGFEEWLGRRQVAWKKAVTRHRTPYAGANSVRPRLRGSIWSAASSRRFLGRGLVTGRRERSPRWDLK